MFANFSLILNQSHSKTNITLLANRQTIGRELRRQDGFEDVYEEPR